MSKFFNKATVAAPSAPLWNYNLQDQIGNGGCHLAAIPNVDAGSTLPQGTLVEVDFKTRDAYIVKCAEIVNGGTTSAPRVNKNHLYRAGDNVYVSGTAVTISSIDKSNISYDVFTLSAPCAGAVSGAFLENSVSAGESPVLAHTPNAVTQEINTDVQPGYAIHAVVISIHQDVDTTPFTIPVSPELITEINKTGRFLFY